jgi:L-lactate dehydrogenase complex protein LldG
MRPDDREHQLLACFRTHGVDVIPLDGIDGLPEAAARYLAANGHGNRLIVSTDERLASLSWATAPDLSPEPWNGEPVADGRAALTHAFAAVAETGTLMLASGPANPATLAFLPEMHLVALSRASVVSAFEEAFAKLRTAYANARFPRALNMVSAPSRTGDIGGRIVLGAHGPRRLAVFLYGPRISDDT